MQSFSHLALQESKSFSRPCLSVRCFFLSSSSISTSFDSVHEQLTSTRKILNKTKVSTHSLTSSTPGQPHSNSKMEAARTQPATYYWSVVAGGSWIIYDRRPPRCILRERRRRRYLRLAASNRQKAKSSTGTIELLEYDERLKTNGEVERSEGWVKRVGTVLNLKVFQVCFSSILHSSDSGIDRTWIFNRRKLEKGWCRFWIVGRWKRTNKDINSHPASLKLFR